MKISNSDFENQMKEPTPDAFKAGLQNALNKVRTGGTEPEESKPKGGRPKGYRKIGGRWLSPEDQAKIETSGVSDADILSVDNFQNALEPFFSRCSEKTIRAGAKLHSSVIDKHAPGFIRNNIDIVLLIAWYVKAVQETAVGIMNSQQGEIPNEVKETPRPQQGEKPTGPTGGTETGSGSGPKSPYPRNTFGSLRKSAGLDQ